MVSITWAMAKGIKIKRETNFFLKIAIKKIIPANISKLPIRLSEDKNPSYFTGI